MRRTRLLVFLFTQHFSENQAAAFLRRGNQKARTTRSSCLDTAWTLPGHAPNSCCGIDLMDSSFFAQDSRRLSGFSLRPGHSLFLWDGSEPGPEFHATPQLAPWAQSSGVLLPQTLSMIKPCPDVDGYYPMVRIMTSVSASSSASPNSCPFPTHTLAVLLPATYLLPTHLSIFSSIRTELVWIFLHPVGPFASSLQSLHAQLPFFRITSLSIIASLLAEATSRSHFRSLCCYCYYCCCFLPQDHHLHSAWPLGHEQVRPLSNVLAPADKLTAPAKQHVLFST